MEIRLSFSLTSDVCSEIKLIHIWLVWPDPVWKAYECYLDLSHFRCLVSLMWRSGIQCPGNRGGPCVSTAWVSVVWWTIRDIFIHINSFQKSSKIKSYFVWEASFLTNNTKIEHFLYISSFSAIFWVWSFLYKIYTSFSVFFGNEIICMKMSRMVHRTVVSCHGFTCVSIVCDVPDTLHVGQILWNGFHVHIVLL